MVLAHMMSLVVWTPLLVTLICKQIWLMEVVSMKSGYDCDGNINVQIGDDGGIVFYVDESGEHGLVSALEDLPGTYEWGVMEYLQEQMGKVGTGYQNTMDIVNSGCFTDNGGITAAQATLDADINGYNDWFLPHKEN